MKRVSFNKNWTFNKQGTSEQKIINLPHDAMLYETRSPEHPTGIDGAYFDSGFYTYEKVFEVPEESADKCTYIQFEGIYQKATAYLNAQKIATHTYGYTPLWIDLTPYLNYGTANTLRVTVDNLETPNSRWYTGAGIYRDVWFWQGEKAHVLPEGVEVQTLS